jgi:hypothetical protein
MFFPKKKSFTADKMTSRKNNNKFQPIMVLQLMPQKNHGLTMVIRSGLR